VTAAANFTHWSVRKDGRLFYTPKAGWLRFALIAMMIGNVIFAVLLLAGILPALPFLTAIFIQLVSHEVYSMWCRHRQYVNA
jgi:hypothetical protein